MMVLEYRVAGVDGLLETTEYPFRPFKEHVFTSFCDRNIVFLAVALNRQFLVVIILLFFKVNHCATFTFYGCDFDISIDIFIN